MRLPVHPALLFGGVALACALCAPAAAQDAGNPNGDVPGNDIWSKPVEETASSNPLGDPIVTDPAIVPAKISPTDPAAPVQGTGGTPEDDPFAAPGIQIGSFVLRPTLEFGLTGQRKTSATQSGAPPVITRSTAYSLLGDSALRLDVESDWSHHAVNVSAEGRLQRTLDGSGTLEPELSVNATARLDIAARTTLTGTFGYSYLQEDPQSAAYLAEVDPALVPPVSGVNKPATQTIEGSLTLRQEAGRFFTEAGIAAARAIYGAAELSDGSGISQTDLDNTTLDGRLRAGIEASAVFAPFVEATYGVRRMDQAPDSGGLDRNAVRYGLRLGTGIDFGEKLNGEISAGYVRENIADPALEDVAGVSVNAKLNWSPRRETNVGLDLSTTTETSGKNGGGGAMLYAAALGVTHRIRANLTADAGFVAEYRHAQASTDETTLSGELALTYWFNRFAGMTTRIGHEETLSPDPVQRTRTTSAYVGLRLQR